LSSYWVGIPPKRKSYYLRFQEKGKKNSTWVSLDTTNEKEAKVRAKLKFDAYHDGRHAALRATAGRNDFPTIGTLCDLYKANATVSDPGHPINSLLRIICIARGCTKEQARALRSDILTDDLVYQFRTNHRAACKQEGRPVSKIGVNSRLTAARSMFTEPKLFYPGETLPDLQGFKDAHGERNASEEAGFEPFEPGLIERMDKAAWLLRELQPDMLRGYVLVRNFGLRTIEVQKAVGAWFTASPLLDDPSRVLLVVRNRARNARRGTAETRIKNGRARFIVVPPEFRDLFAGFEPEQHVLLPTATAPARQRFIQRTLSAWVRQFIPDRVGSTYELRKHAGSEVLTRSGKIAEAAAFLGDSVATAEKWYAKWLKEVGAAVGEVVEAPKGTLQLHNAAVELLALLDAGVTGEALESSKARLRAAIAPGQTPPAFPQQLAA
jgi:hypothetical protein